MAINNEENFGRVLCMSPFDTEEENIRLANDTVYSLGVCIRNSDMEKAGRVAKYIRAGNLSINGRENGVYGLHDFLYIKANTLWFVYPLRNRK